MGSRDGVTCGRFGGGALLERGNAARTSAEPDFEVEARLPCFAMRRRDEARMEEVVLILNVL